MDIPELLPCSDAASDGSAPLSPAMPSPIGPAPGSPPMDAMSLDLACTVHKWIRVRAVFLTYCTVHQIPHADGVKSWDQCDAILLIIQDTSSQKAHSTASHILPSKYLTLPESLCALAIEQDFLTNLSSRPGESAHVQAVARMPVSARLAEIHTEIEARLAQLGRASLYET